MNPQVLLRDQRAGRWLQFADPQAHLVARDPGEIVAVIQQAHALARAGLHVAGFISYEAAAAFDPSLRTHAAAALPLAWFTGFTSASPVASPRAVLPPPELTWTPDITEAAYRQALAEIRALIAAGDTYQVNFSYRLRASLDPHALGRLPALFASMVARQPNGLGAYLETDQWAILCASHELFFEVTAGRIRSRPMKGTVTRGTDPESDAANARWLAGSAKNRAENLMITDMVRNDLGRIAHPGTVRTSNLFALEPYPTLWQMTSTITAISDADLTGILQALFPAASITGAPKHRTMAIICALEATPRQIYTGTIGYLRPDGSAQFNVAIRTALVDKRTGAAEYGVGGGIVWDSDPTEELIESQAKSLIVVTPAPRFELLETLLWTPTDGYARCAAHLARLQRSAAFFDYPFDQTIVTAALEQAAAAFPPGPCRVRLRLDASGQPHLSHSELRSLPSDYRVRLAAYALPREDDPFVLNKTTNRVVYEQARAGAADADDVLLWNSRGELTESTIGNLVVELDGEWFTPPVSSGLLPGIYRQHLLDSGQVRERILFPSDLPRCSRIMLANSVRGLWPIRLLEG
jgi:para-aminobenzoate synthetase/4-amino-4-deoxychorismate lyase